MTGAALGFPPATGSPGEAVKYALGPGCSYLLDRTLVRDTLGWDAALLPTRCRYVSRQGEDPGVGFR